MEPDLTSDIFDALGLGEGQSGKTLEAAETFLLADAYNPGDPDDMPVILHPATGRRWVLSLHESDATSPPDPYFAKQNLHEPVVTEISPSQAADGATHPQPPIPDETDEGRVVGEQQIERPEPIQSFSHAPQPEQPEPNVPEDFELNVEAHNANLAPGAPLPNPEDD